MDSLRSWPGRDVSGTGNPEWNQVFAISHTRPEPTLEISVWDGGAPSPIEAFLGGVCFDLSDVPVRDQPNGLLAPQWYTRSKVYQSPKLWYLRASVIEAQDLRVPAPPPGLPFDVRVKIQLGFQSARTRRSVASSSGSAFAWSEDLMFVASEPLDDNIIVLVEDRSMIKEPTLLGGYHLLDEAAHVCSDYRPAAKQLWKSSVGVLELGIIGACGLLPMKTKGGAKGSTDAYCVAKYGKKWVHVSTLESNRVYTVSYPLLVLLRLGLKKMGEVQLAVRFSSPVQLPDTWATYMELDALSAMPGFVTAVPNQVYKLLTMHMPQFLGLELPQSGRNYTSKFGEGVIIGMLDSGVYPFHPLLQRRRHATAADQVEQTLRLQCLRVQQQAH
ncbi:protein QUIRKY-like [Miscanthus floridulus]|uniref:protein QUIRKY-like n=1 Tax=Miscanthus floridulus TaxID=154761 RepID=UPI003459C7AA